MFRVAIIGLSVLATAAFGQPQTFECRLGTSSACLQPGETVCSARGRCVGRDASCFDRAQCDEQGFTCTSNVRDCQDSLALLAEAHRDLQARHAALEEQLAELSAAAMAMGRENDRLIACVRAASLGTEAFDCLG